MDPDKGTDPEDAIELEDVSAPLMDNALEGKQKCPEDCAVTMNSSICEPTYKKTLGNSSEHSNSSMREHEMEAIPEKQKNIRFRVAFKDSQQMPKLGFS